ncbi:hypothetical protein TREES_T100020308 [Tupaia chinensis]|uniref:Uncharacterized protein n=1 Tax=Tupaia chinensis TaxID=246437 RepID=L9L528_TUPCH|nr:hypothetical protein TREES_T100020308 [Tupaia chinensis]
MATDSTFELQMHGEGEADAADQLARFSILHPRHKPEIAIGRGREGSAKALRCFLVLQTVNKGQEVGLLPSEHIPQAMES